MPVVDLIIQQTHSNGGGIGESALAVDDRTKVASVAISIEYVSAPVTIFHSKAPSKAMSLALLVGAAKVGASAMAGTVVKLQAADQGLSPPAL